MKRLHRSLQKLKARYRARIPSERLLFGRMFVRQWLQVSTVRHFVALSRYAYFVWVRKQLRTFRATSGGVAQNTIWHNMSGLYDLVNSRSNRLILPLCAIETYRPLATINGFYDLDSVCHAKVLSVGPRTEGELLNLISHGFRPCNVRGLDLISYSPWIDLGDMHAMPYADSTWDIVILSAVLGYSETPEQAAREVVRVLKNGGLVAVENEYEPRDNDAIIRDYGYLAGSSKRYDRVETLLDIFNPHVDQVFFQHDLTQRHSQQKSTVSVIFSIKK